MLPQQASAVDRFSLYLMHQNRRQLYHSALGIMNNKDVHVQLGARIKDLRTGKGISIEELAEKVEIRPVTLVNIERGLFAVKYELIFTIAEALNMRLDFVPVSNL